MIFWPTFLNFTTPLPTPLKIYSLEKFAVKHILKNGVSRSFRFHFAHNASVLASLSLVYLKISILGPESRLLASPKLA